MFKLVVKTVVVGLLSLSAAQPAAAHSIPVRGESSVLVADCVETDVWENWNFQYGGATNGCEFKPRLKMVWTRARDGGCKTYQLGEEHIEKRHKFVFRMPVFEGVNDC